MSIQELSVLVIDDDEDDLFLICEHLNAIDTFKIHIDKELNYKKASEKIRQNEHDVYIIDYLLGPHTGIELIRSSISAGITKPFILLTGRGDKKIDIEAANAGAYDYLTKSEINTELLERSLRYSVQRYSAFIKITESEKRYREIFTKSNDIIFTLDKDFQLINFNPMMTTSMGYEPDELYFCSITKLFPTEEDGKKFIHHIKSKTPIDNIEIGLLTKEGQRKIFLASCSRILSHEKTESYQGILCDYTNLKKVAAEQLKRETTHKLVQSLAHEIRTPLTNINLSTHQLEEDINEEKIIFTDIIKRNCKRINDLIVELINLSAPPEKNYKPIELKKALDSALSVAKDRIKLKGVEVVETLSEQQPLIMGDLKEMEIALLNVIINAVEAVDEAKGKLEIETKVLENTAHIKISDNGSGIAAENLSHLFQPYYTDKKNGMGLGLATTHSVITAHDGSIEVDSVLGKGTVFTIKLKTV